MIERIYRVQDAEGRGPYRPGMSEKWADNGLGTNYFGKYTRLSPFIDEFPGVLDEINLIFDVSGGAFGCGFADMKQLRKWFSKTELDKLYKLGYRIVVIKPDKIIRSSDKQTVFWCKEPLAKIASPISEVAA